LLYRLCRIVRCLLICTLAVCAVAALSCAPLIPLHQRHGGKKSTTASSSSVTGRDGRVYGGNEEILPPILLMPSNTVRSAFTSSSSLSSNTSFRFGSASLTFEVDVWSEVIPNLAVQFVHCDAFWNEDSNLALNDPAAMRTTLIDWQQAAPLARYYTYRGTFAIPNAQVHFTFSGNWKAKIIDMSEYSPAAKPLAELRFFVVEMAASSTLEMAITAYRPKAVASPSAYIWEGTIQAPQQLLDAQLHSAVLYRNHRWYEPFVITEDQQKTPIDQMFLNNSHTSVFGMAQAGKRFRIEGIPVQNEYRVLDLTNTLTFPVVNAPLRMPLADLRRSGSGLQRANDGALVTRQTAGFGGLTGNEDFVNLEFVLDPERFASRFDVFVVGSCTNWKVLPEWKMQYDRSKNLYTLSQWVRSGIHNYMYATGMLGADAHADSAVNFEEYEGNSLGAGNTFFMFFYYQDPSFGGYDRIVSVAARNPAAR